MVDMSAFRPPVKYNRSQTSASLSPPDEKNQKESRKSFSGTSRRISRGRLTPTTGLPVVNRIIGNMQLEIDKAPVGQRPMVIANAQAKLNDQELMIKESIEKYTKRLEDLKLNPKTSQFDIEKQENVIKIFRNKLRDTRNASKTLLSTLGKKRTIEDVPEPSIKRTKSTNNVTIRQNIIKPIPERARGKYTSTGSDHKAKNTPKFVPIDTGSPPNREPIPKRTIESISRETKTHHAQAKRQIPPSISEVAIEAAQDIKTRNDNHFKKMSNAVKEKRSPRVKRRLFNTDYEKTKQLIKTTKKQTNIERKLELKNYITKADFNKLMEKIDKPRTPVKQQLTKENVTDMLKPLFDKKQTKFSLFGSLGDLDKKKLFARRPESIAKAVANKFRKEFIERIQTKPGVKPTTKLKTGVYTRTPTSGQRKKHVIELISRVLKRMKLPSDLEKRVINFYEALSEKYIKQTFGGKTREDVKKIISEQVEFLKNKNR